MFGIALSMMLATAAPPFTCGAATYVPPVDFDATGRPIVMEFAVATAPKTGPGGMGSTVDATARSLLVNRLCRLADPRYCGPLEAKVAIWKRAETATQVCAMSVLRTTDLEAWRTMLAPDLDAELRQAFELLFPEEELPTRRKGIFGRKRRVAAVLLDRIDDQGAPGGIRADWLLGRVRASLTSLNIDMMDPPKGWNGRAFPRGVDYAVRGTLAERVDPKKQLPVIDVSFTIVNAKRLQRTSTPFTIPAALAPSPPPLVNTPPPTQGLSLHVETRAGGSLCPGDFTQIHLTNETDDPLFVRVLNLDQNGEALVLFPNEVRGDDMVPAHGTVTLAPDGFNVDGAAHGRERYIAVGAKSREALGRFRDTRGTCRYRPEDAKVLASGAKVEASYRAVAGFTILDDVRCRKPIPLPDPALLSGLLADVPLCPPLER